MPFKESKHQWSMWEYEKQSESQLSGQEEELWTERKEIYEEKQHRKEKVQSW